MPSCEASKFFRSSSVGFNADHWMVSFVLPPSSTSVAMDNMVDASKDTEQFKTEVSKLTGNLHSLNTVYGNMLNAMRA